MSELKKIILDKYKNHLEKKINNLKGEINKKTYNYSSEYYYYNREYGRRAKIISSKKYSEDKIKKMDSLLSFLSEYSLVEFVMSDMVGDNLFFKEVFSKFNKEETKEFVLLINENLKKGDSLLNFFGAKNFSCGTLSQVILEDEKIFGLFFNKNKIVLQLDMFEQLLKISTSTSRMAGFKNIEKCFNKGITEETVKKIEALENTYLSKIQLELKKRKGGEKREIIEESNEEVDKFVNETTRALVSSNFLITNHHLESMGFYKVELMFSETFDFYIKTSYGNAYIQVKKNNIVNTLEFDLEKAIHKEGYDKVLVKVLKQSLINMIKEVNKNIGSSQCVEIAKKSFQDSFSDEQILKAFNEIREKNLLDKIEKKDDVEKSQRARLKL